MPATAVKPSPVLVSRAGVPLTRAVTFRFTLDPNQAQHQVLLCHAGAARMAFNHQLGRVKANLDLRAAERSAGVADADLTARLSWTNVSLINLISAWKDGRAPDAPVTVADNGASVRGLPWRGEVSADVFECASVNAAQALPNWSASRRGAWAGRTVGFPRFKDRHRTASAFRLRAKYTEGELPPVRPAGPRTLRFPKIGELRVAEHTGQLSKLFARGRFHIYAASFRFEHGRWLVSVTGMAAQLHHARRSPAGRHPKPVGGWTWGSIPSPWSLTSTVSCCTSGRG
jgi:putative transposase